MTDQPITLDDVRNTPGVTGAERLDLQAGDILVVRLPPGATDQEWHKTAERLRGILRDKGVTVITAENGVEFTVYAVKKGEPTA